MYPTYHAPELIAIWAANHKPHVCEQFGGRRLTLYI